MAIRSIQTEISLVTGIVEKMKLIDNRKKKKKKYS